MYVDTKTAVMHSSCEYGKADLKRMPRGQACRYSRSNRPYEPGLRMETNVKRHRIDCQAITIVLWYMQRSELDQKILFPRTPVQVRSGVSIGHVQISCSALRNCDWDLKPGTNDM